MQGHAPGTVGRFAALPILCAHVHSERRYGLLSIGNDVDVMSALGQRVRGPIVAHAHAALDRRILADDANSQKAISRRPLETSSSSSASASSVEPNVSRSVHSPRAEIRPKIVGSSWYT